MGRNEAYGSIWRAISINRVIIKSGKSGEFICILIIIAREE